MLDIQKVIEKLRQCDYRSIAQCITLVENELPDHDAFMLALPHAFSAQVIGITGSPGAGKSTLINALLKTLTAQHKRIAVLSVDPSSPFNFGALLGDRVRMSEFYLNSNVYIRSLASRGALGGLSSKIIEIVDVLRVCPFDYIIIETVGVGQSEVEIAGLADTTIVVTVPEGGDEVQTMKAGVMEIADIFVVNKADRTNADEFVKNLKILSHSKANSWEIPVLKCVANAHIGTTELVAEINAHADIIKQSNEKKIALMSEKAYHLIQQKRMSNVSKTELHHQLYVAMNKEHFNLYKFVKDYF